LMDAVKAGGDRQELHEKIREMSMEAGRNVKENGQENNLLELIAKDSSFDLSEADLERVMDPSRYVGRSGRQVEAYLADHVRPVLAANQGELGMMSDITV
ncbi:MAG: adenylosuccinate lyase, partial [Suipraeoptans intestinalis]|nr:adenylosuccinate lyase [Suipraeoptans intestinalis]